MFAWKLALERREQVELAGLDDAGDLAGEILADPRQLRQVLAGLQQAGDALRQRFDHPGGATIGAGAKRVLALDLEKFGRLVEHLRDFGILHRHRRPTCVGIPRSEQRKEYAPDRGSVF